MFELIFVYHLKSFSSKKKNSLMIKLRYENPLNQDKQNLLGGCGDLTCPAASVSPHRALDAKLTLSPKASTSPVLQC